MAQRVGQIINELFTTLLHYSAEGEVMRMVLAAAGLVIVIGVGGAYALMRGQPAPKQAPAIATKPAPIPKVESTRLAALSTQGTDPTKSVVAPFAKAAVPIPRPKPK